MRGSPTFELFLLLCSLVVLAYATICLGVLNLILVAGHNGLGYLKYLKCVITLTRSVATPSLSMLGIESFETSKLRARSRVAGRSRACLRFVVFLLFRFQIRVSLLFLSLAKKLATGFDLAPSEIIRRRKVDE